MDKVDFQIIKLLEENGRMTHEDIGKELHISRPSVHQRVSKMENSGVLKGYRSIVDWNKLDQKIKAIIFIKIKCSDFREIASKIITLEIPGVKILEAQRLAGEWCIMLKVRVADPRDITLMIDEIVKYPEVQETSTTFILSTILEDGNLEIGYEKKKEGITNESKEVN